MPSGISVPNSEFIVLQVSLSLMFLSSFTTARGKKGMRNSSEYNLKKY